VKVDKVIAKGKKALIEGDQKPPPLSLFKRQHGGVSVSLGGLRKVVRHCKRPGKVRVKTGFMGRRRSVRPKFTEFQEACKRNLIFEKEINYGKAGTE